MFCLSVCDAHCNDDVETDSLDISLETFLEILGQRKTIRTIMIYICTSRSF